MGAHSTTLHPDEDIRIGTLGKRIATTGFGLGIVALAIAVVLGLSMGDHMRRFFLAYLVAVSLFTTFALGALWFVIIQHLVRARWSVGLRRIAEILSQTFPVLGVLVAGGVLIPMLAGSHSLYAWSDHALVEGDHLLHGKTAWLNVVFFALRIVVYFGIWTFLARHFFKKSVEQDESGDPAISERLRVLAGPAIVVFALSLAFASFDLLMTLTPHWYSTMWPVYFFAGCALSIFALLALVPMALQKAGKLRHSINTEHYHDVGKMLFAFIFFWGYVSFSQFMLYWYADLPEETVWFRIRMFSDWKYVSFLLLFGHFVFPFLCLLSRETKRRLQLLALFSAWMLIMHVVDLYWIVMPSLDVNAYLMEGFTTTYTFSFSRILLDVLAVVGVGGIFFATAAKVAGPVHLIPTKDPGLAESLAFQNY